MTCQLLAEILNCNSSLFQSQISTCGTARDEVSSRGLEPQAQGLLVALVLSLYLALVLALAVALSLAHVLAPALTLDLVFVLALVLVLVLTTLLTNFIKKSFRGVRHTQVWNGKNRS